MRKGKTMTKKEAPESKNEKFKRLAAHRVNNVLKSIQVLSNCSGPAYEYGSEEVTSIFSAIEVKLSEARDRFDKKGGSEVKKFNF